MSNGPSAATTAATIEGGGTNLSEYRAFLQVLVYASQKQHAAVDVVLDAQMGGVVACFMHNSQQCSHNVLLPSSKTIGTMTPLVSEGFFSPSLSHTQDNVFGTSYQPLSESLGRDAFTLIILLFPDCFVSGSPMADTVLETAASSLAPTPDVEAEANNSLVTPPNLKRSQNTMNSTIMTSRSHSLSTSLHAPTASLVTSQSQPIVADIFKLHTYRIRVACLLLSVFNDTLHDVQVRQLMKARTGPLERKDTDAVGAEESNLVAVKRIWEQAKLMLICCACSSELAFRAWRLEAAQSNDVDPRHILEDLVGTQFSEPVEQWDWGRNAEQCDIWYDTLLGGVNHVFAERAGMSLQAFLKRTKEAALREDGRKRTHAPELLLHRATDGHRGVTLELLPFCVIRPSLPSLPVQAGELATLSPPSHSSVYHDGLLFDDISSPLNGVLQRWISRKLTDAQMKEEQATFFTTPWDTLSSGYRRILSGFLLFPEHIAKILDKNPAVLARVVLWTYHIYGEEATALLPTEKGDSSDCFFPVPPGSPRNALAEDILQYVLFDLPFSSAVGHFVRELAVHYGLSQPTVLKWIDVQKDRLCAPHTKTFVLLIEYLLVQMRWSLPPSTATVLEEIKQTK